MSWEFPNLSKGDIELLTIALDEYLYVSNLEIPDMPKMEKLLHRLEDHLNKF
jgi:hypothetical protein